MREKPVPTRVEKVPQQSGMDSIKNETDTEKESLSSDEGDELPSMVTVLPVNSENTIPSKYEGPYYVSSSSENRSILDIPGEFEFLNSDNVSESQKQAVKFGVRVFRDWLNKQGVNFRSLEEMTREDIAIALEQFYLTARRPNGTQYKKNTLKSIKHSLDHYLRSSPLKKDFSISSDFDFRKVNKTLDSLPEDADPNRFPQFTKDIILKLYAKGQLGLTTTDDPTILIQTVWFYVVSYFFANIDKRMLRELKDTNLVLEKDHENREYYWLDYQPPERVRGDVIKSRIYARPNSLCCPVAIIKKYIEHRNPRNNVLFQHPKSINSVVWYSPLPLGKNKHTDLMKSMCMNAGVEPPLTGRCIKSYVQQLLQDCDDKVNKMFRLDGPSNGFISNIQAPIVPPFIVGMPKLPSAMASHEAIVTSTTSVTPCKKARDVTAAPGTTNGSKHVTSQCAQSLLELENNKIAKSLGLNTSLNYTSHSDAMGSQPSNFVFPYLGNFPSITDFAKPKDLFNGNSLFNSSFFTNGFDHSNTGSKSYFTPNHFYFNGSKLDQNSSNTNFMVTKPTPKERRKDEESPTHQVRFMEISTQTEPQDKQCLESAYHKADLKTRNRMRYQARKSLLCFMEELNEISDGHGMELFHEIVREDTTMLKSFTHLSTIK